jgi:hypothetical protein
MNPIDMMHETLGFRLVCNRSLCLATRDSKFDPIEKPPTATQSKSSRHTCLR